MERIYRRFERWRKSHRGRLPIPAPLWAAAAEVAREHGLFRTAKTLRLEHNKLKRMVASAKPAVRRAPAPPENRQRPFLGDAPKWPPNGRFQESKIRQRFRPGTEAGENVSCGLVRPCFHERSADTTHAESRHAGVCWPAWLDYRLASPGSWLRRGKARGAEETAGCCHRRDIGVVLVWRWIAGAGQSQT